MAADNGWRWAPSWRMRGESDRWPCDPKRSAPFTGFPSTPRTGLAHKARIQPWSGRTLPCRRGGVQDETGKQGKQKNQGETGESTAESRLANSPGSSDNAPRLGSHFVAIDRLTR